MTLRRTAIAAALVALALVGPAGCGGGDRVEGPPPPAPETMKLTSDAFAGGAEIPVRFTCDGEDVAPPLAWDGAPDGSAALAVVVEDPDAPGGTFVHWLVLDLPPAVSALAGGEVPAGAVEGTNSFGDRGYGGPCPPEGDAPHRYVFLVYALGSALGAEADGSPAEVRAAIGRRAIARARLVGRFGR